MTTITHPVCEYRTNPLGIDITTPRLSWQLSAGRQTAYRIFAASDPQRLSEGQADLWDSGHIESDQSVHVVYGGQKTASRQRVYWRVSVWADSAAVVPHADTPVNALARSRLLPAVD
ncbi:MAG: alpha-L-rhamnosidase, partial [Anaerolineae bacterium]|nr:alpha-L-rhamnosidase [Anaerolineae bacterium]